MPTWHRFRPAGCEPSLSFSLRRRLELLQIILPRFTNTMAHQRPTCSRRSLPFWTDCLMPCMKMDLGQWVLDKLDDRHGQLVQDLLRGLESTIGLEDSHIAETCADSHFPRLDTLRVLLNDATDTSILLLPCVLIQPKDLQNREILTTSLKALAEILEDHDEQPLPESTTRVSRYRYPMADSLLRLFSTVSKHLKCKCADHRAMLPLFAQQSISNENITHAFTVFLSRKEQGYPWREIGFSVQAHVPKPGKRVVFSGQASREQDHLRKLAAPETVNSLCETINESHEQRLNLRIKGSLLLQLARTNRELKGFEEGLPISFEDGYLNNGSERGVKDRTCLAVVLSYALLDFIGKPWWSHGWSSKSMLLLQYSTYILLRPIIVVDGLQNSRSDLFSKIDHNSKLLFHGILLMEVFCQQPFRTNTSYGPDVDVEKLRLQAQKEFQRIEWGVSERFEQSVKACLEGYKPHVSHEHNSESKDDEVSFSAFFLESIITPLEADFNLLWDNNDLDADEALSTIKLPPFVESKSAWSKRKPPIKPKPANLGSGPSKHIHTNITEVNLGRFDTESRWVKLFDTRISKKSIDVLGANDWFQRLDNARESSYTKAEEKGSGIKVAILDTGIDLSNPWIQARSSKILCWPNNEACHDEDGHGTHIAYLLLRIAPGLQLYVSKISASQLIENVDVDTISQAIDRFSSGDNKVDLINISFGFPKFDPRLEPIRQAIRTANENRVMVFAAAGNDGGNDRTAWPASLYERRDVISIYSLDGRGAVSAFNSSSTNDSLLCTLGEAIPSSECSEDGDIIHRSGTSFATPIAVATAAIVLGFLEKISLHTSGKFNPKFAKVAVVDDFEELKLLARTHPGMKQILRATCVLPGGNLNSKFCYIAPRWFIEMEANSRLGYILNELRNLNV